jgi:hypothetical protein
MIMTWVAVLFVIIVGALLAYWHFSGKQIVWPQGRAGDGFFDGVSGIDTSDHGHDGAGSDGGADAGGGH